jgi:nitrate reductase gamma subunit
VSDLLCLAEHGLQEAALAFMGSVYVVRLIWFFRYRAGVERQAPTSGPGTSPAKGIVYSWANIAMPWAMESTRTQFLLYLQFVVFHVGVAASIALSFVIPYLPGLLEMPGVAAAFQVLAGLACAVGLMRMVRRIANPYMRAISSPDDYFSLALLTAWLLMAALAAPNRAAEGEGVLLAYFLLTAFFLVYVPFSKISHYLYYPFTRYYLGKSMGRRGVYPLRRGPQPIRR